MGDVLDVGCARRVTRRSRFNHSVRERRAMTGIVPTVHEGAWFPSDSHVVQLSASTSYISPILEFRHKTVCSQWAAFRSWQRYGPMVLVADGLLPLHSPEPMGSFGVDFFPAPLGAVPRAQLCWASRRITPVAHGGGPGPRSPPLDPMSVGVPEKTINTRPASLA